MESNTEIGSNAEPAVPGYAGESRDMTYGELIGLMERLVGLGVLREDDVVMRFIQQPDVCFACPVLYVMRRERVEELIRQNMPNLPAEDVSPFVEKSSVKNVKAQIAANYAGRLDENIGLLDFKDASKPENEKFGGYLTAVGFLHHKMNQQGLVGIIDGPDEKSTAVFMAKVFNGKWIPVIAKLPDDEGNVRKLLVPPEIQSKLAAYMQQAGLNKLVPMSLSSLEPDVVEFLEISRNPHLYDGQDTVSGS